MHLVSQTVIQLCVFHLCPQVVSPEKYEVKGSAEDSAIILTSCTEPKMQVTITLTSPVIREENSRDGGLETQQSSLHCTSSLVSLTLPNEVTVDIRAGTLESTVLLALHRARSIGLSIRPGALPCVITCRRCVFRCCFEMFPRVLACLST